ncbi:glycoside hydrolase family 2 TIM barrel-domain containing protein [Phocaeicola sp.]
MRILLLFVFSFSLFVGHAQRESKTLNDGWFFSFQKDFRQAEQIAVPHTWNTDAYIRKDYYKGLGYYKRQLLLPKHWEGKQLFLKFDGVSKYAGIFVNGQEVGEHKGGYTAFTLDITPFCCFDKINEITVCADNSCEDIPPVSGDFTFFGGMYRDVWLIAVPRQHFNLTNYGSDGIFITTPQVSEERATLRISGEIKNDGHEKASLELEQHIYQPDGKLLQTQKQPVQIKEGETYTFTQETSPILNPRLWTPETPYLYKVETVLRDRKTKIVLDHSEHYTAFRWFHFDGKEGFFLNGKPYKLRGICRHQDQKPIGVALTDEMHRRDFLLMKEMGANFIRVSHYPQDDALLEMCDKLGMLAWEEIPIIDIVPDTPGYGDACERNLREMIRQHYNHPSIIAWGYMNEILLVTQRRYKTETEIKPVLERTLALAKRLEKTLKEEDTTRVSAMAFHGSNVYNEIGLGQITDIVGWNLYQGWYGGDLTGFERYLEEQQRDYPGHPVIVSEYGAGSDKRLHSLHPHAFDFSSEYQQLYLEHYLPVLEETPYVCGGTHWNFIDFSSALRDESMSRINNKGLVYADRTPKDVYFYYQAAWRKDIPVLHIASRDWNYRSGVQQGDAPVVLPVKVYSNLPEVELFIDGKSVGKKKVENYRAVFDVPFIGKTPYLSALGLHRGQKAEDGVRVHFTPIPARLNNQNLNTLELAVNVGSDCFFTSDESQLTWIPDRPYVEGSWGYIGGKEQSTQTEIHQTADGPLYQTMREELESYRFDVPQGMYEVELLFADIYRPATSAAYLLGKENQASAGIGNHFDICMNGELVETDFALYRDNGYFQAVRKRYLIQNKQDFLEIDLKPLQGKCFLSGIKLRKL